MRRIVLAGLAAAAALALGGCRERSSADANASDGVTVKADGTEVRVAGNGVDVDADGTEVRVDGDGISVNLNADELKATVRTGEDPEVSVTTNRR